MAKLGDAPIDGKTDTNPEGLTAATGKHAEAFAARLAAGDLSCKVPLPAMLLFGQGSESLLGPGCQSIAMS